MPAVKDYNLNVVPDIRMSVIRAELHCHNSFSNFNLGADEPPYDCDVSIRDQLERAHALELDMLFVTNHNTLDGYTQMLEYKKNHAKFDGITVYPAEEVTTDTGAHVLAYGIYEPIPANTPLAEIVDTIREQGGVSSAPHPFSLLDALRDDAVECDMIETFNSNNVDQLSNVYAAEFAVDRGMTQVAGSDSHVLSTLGRCVNTIHAENNLDDVLQALKHGRVSIDMTGYAMYEETLAHLKYKLNNSREYVAEYINEHYPNAKWLLRLLLRIYDMDQDSHMWRMIYSICLYAMRRISKKINSGGLDPEAMKQRNLGTMLRMSL